MFKGDVVYFSFEFKLDNDKGYKQTNWTESGSIKNPDYDVVITYIGKSPQPEGEASQSAAGAQKTSPAQKSDPRRKESARCH